MYEGERKAAMIIQRWYRKQKFEKDYAKKKGKLKCSQKFRTENYYLRDNYVKHGIREVRLVMKVKCGWSDDWRYPDVDKPRSVLFEVREEDKFDPKKHKIIYRIDHPIKVFGFKGKQHPTRDEVCIRVQSLFN